MRKPTFCICENKGADQLRSNCAADQSLCFRFKDSTIPLLPNPNFQASSNLLRMYSPISVEPGRKPRRQVFMRHGSLSATVVINIVVKFVPGEYAASNLSLENLLL